jgi:hypothetical protein
VIKLCDRFALPLWGNRHLVQGMREYFRCNQNLTDYLFSRALTLSVGTDTYLVAIVMKKKDLDQLFREVRHYYHQRQHSKFHRVRRLLSQHLSKLQQRIAQEMRSD